MDSPTDRLRALVDSPRGLGSLRILQLITGAMLSGAFLIGPVFFFLAPIQQGKPAGPEAGELVQQGEQNQMDRDLPMVLVSALLGIGAVTFSTVFQMFQGRRNRDALAGAEGSPQVDQILNSTVVVGILTNAVREGAYLVSCVFGLVSENPTPFFAIAGVILVLWAVQFPTRRAFERHLGLD